MRPKGAEKDLSLMDVLTPRQFAVTMLVASKPHKQGHRPVYGDLGAHG